MRLSVANSNASCSLGFLAPLIALLSLLSNRERDRLSCQARIQSELRVGHFIIDPRPRVRSQDAIFSLTVLSELFTPVKSFRLLCRSLISSVKCLSQRLVATQDKWTPVNLLLSLWKNEGVNNFLMTVVTVTSLKLGDNESTSLSVDGRCSCFYSSCLCLL